MWVNLFKIFEPPRIGAVVGGDGGSRDGGDSRHPKGTTTPRIKKPPSLLGWRSGMGLTEGWWREPLPLNFMITHIFIERKINKPVALHIVELTKELHFCEYFYIHFGGYSLLVYLFHTLIYLKRMVTILIIIMYIMSCILFGGRKSYIIICFVSEIS